MLKCLDYYFLNKSSYSPPPLYHLNPNSLTIIKILSYLMKIRGRLLCCSQRLKVIVHFFLIYRPRLYISWKWMFPCWAFLWKVRYLWSGPTVTNFPQVNVQPQFLVLTSNSCTFLLRIWVEDSVDWFEKFDLVTAWPDLVKYRFQNIQGW